MTTIQKSFDSIINRKKKTNPKTIMTIAKDLQAKFEKQFGFNPSINL